jgi:beta-phosphoglucomutase
MSLKAIIFDFNGVIVNDEPIHLAMYQKVLREEGIKLSAKEYYKKYLAYDDRNCFEKILTQAGKPATSGIIQELIKRKAVYYEAYMEKNLCIFPYVKNCIKKLARKYPLAIASAALRDEIRWLLKRSGILSYFKIIVGAEDTKRSKPDPESYLLALKKLNLRKNILPKECLVIEDSIHGVEGTRRAGMKCLAVAHTYPKSKLKNADLVIAGFKNFSLRKILKLFE